MKAFTRNAFRLPEIYGVGDFRSVEMKWQIYLSTIARNTSVEGFETEKDSFERYAPFSQSSGNVFTDNSVMVVRAAGTKIVVQTENFPSYELYEAIFGRNPSNAVQKELLSQMRICVEWDPVLRTSKCIGLYDSDTGAIVDGREALEVFVWMLLPRAARLHENSIGSVEVENLQMAFEKFRQRDKLPALFWFVF